jgi:monoterpene epsilon-lactone hydrolase
MDTHEIDAVRAMLGAKPRPVGWVERRARIEEVGASSPVASDISLEPVTLGGVHGEYSLAPGSDPSRLLAYFHGGGFCSGSIISHRRLVTEAGRAAGIRTLAVAYRLAPEHPFPAAHEDALAVWHALRAEGVPAERIAAGGDSAGGNLAIGLANRLRAAGEPQPACLWLLSPWTDLAMTGESLAVKDTDDPLIHKPYLEELAHAYLDGRDRNDPLVSPLRADLQGLPPTLVQVGSAETLLDDSVRFARAAGLADVAVTLEVWPRMIHAFPMWNARLADGRRALAEAGAWMRGHLDG